MSFNLSEWALKNRTLVLYAMILLGAMGAISYANLGQSEDPPFTFKLMTINTLWPGASAEEVSRQITERVEKKLMETGDFERITSYSRPGQSLVMFMARDEMRSKDIKDLWYQVRKKIGDIRHTLPQDVRGPFFNDEFGTTFGNIYAAAGGRRGQGGTGRSAGRKDLGRNCQYQTGIPGYSIGDGSAGIAVAERRGRCRFF